MKTEPTTEKTLLLATHNQGKINEIKALLDAFSLSIESASLFFYGVGEKA